MPRPNMPLSLIWPLDFDAYDHGIVKESQRARRNPSQPNVRPVAVLPKDEILLSSVDTRINA